MSEWNGIELDAVVLSSERLTLRPWRRDDVAAVATAMAEPAMRAFLPLPDPYTWADAERFVTELAVRDRRAGTGITCAVVETRTGSLVGAASLRLPGGQDVAAEVGYWVAVSAWGHGYAAEATRALAGWAFGHGVHRVEIRCAVGNVASARTALAAGFRFEGILRGKELTPRGPEDGAIFGRLAGDDGEPIRDGWPQPLRA